MIKAIGIGNRLMMDDGIAIAVLENITNKLEPMGLGRIIRSFDPCISCATHVYIEGKYARTMYVVS